MNKAKIRLSAKEMELVSNPDIILTKNNVLNKAVSILKNLRESYIEIIREKKGSVPEEFNLSLINHKRRKLSRFAIPYAGLSGNI